MKARSRPPVPQGQSNETPPPSSNEDGGEAVGAREATSSLTNLYRAMRKCFRGVMWKQSVTGYRHHHLRRLLKLRASLLNGTYRQSRGCSFKVHEPKERDIVSTLFKDRVPLTSLLDNYLYDEVCLNFEDENCACQKGKGTDYAREMLKAFLRDAYADYGMDGAVLCADIKAFFASIRHDIAKEVMAERVKDRFAIGMVYNDIDVCKGEIGIDLGSPMNQIIALSMLDDMDKALKRSDVRFVRYMDDIVVIGKSKGHLKAFLSLIEEELGKKSLALSPKKTHIAPIGQPIHFLGFSSKIHPTGKLTMRPLREKVRKRMRKLRKQKDLVLQGVLTKEKFAEIYQGGRDHFKKGTRSTLRKMDAFFNSLMEEITMNEEIIMLRRQVEALEDKVLKLEAIVAKLELDNEGKEEEETENA